jgi:hypothetical protein
VTLATAPNRLLYLEKSLTDLLINYERFNYSNFIRVQIVFAYAAVTLYGPAFQRGSTNDWIGNSTIAGPTTPVTPEAVVGFRLAPSPLARQRRHYPGPVPRIAAALLSITG